jgi:hypothetical protein
VEDEFMDAEAFINYVDSELGNKPSTKHSLDRIDNNKGYERGNLRWATRAEQARNRRSTTMILLCGQEITLPDACDIFGVKRKIAYQQIARGWPLVDVFLGKPKRSAA